MGSVGVDGWIGIALRVLSFCAVSRIEQAIVTADYALVREMVEEDPGACVRACVRDQNYVLVRTAAASWLGGLNPPLVQSTQRWCA